MSGLPLTQGNQGTQGNSENFQVEKNPSEAQGSFDFFYKIQGSFKILKSKDIFFAIFRMRFN